MKNEGGVAISFFSTVGVQGKKNNEDMGDRKENIPMKPM
jgi:hypothetical protein